VHRQAQVTGVNFGDSRLSTPMGGPSLLYLKCLY